MAAVVVVPGGVVIKVANDGEGKKKQVNYEADGYRCSIMDAS